MRKGTVAFVAVGVVACGAAYLVGSNWPRAKSVAPAAALEDSPALVIDSAALNLGEVWESVAHTVELDVKNTTAERVTVQRFESGCNCTSISPESLTIEPHATGRVTATINTTHRLPHQRGVAKWPLAVGVTAIVDQADKRGHSWQITATVKAWASTPTPWLDFDDRCQHDGPPSTRTVRLKRHAAFDRLEAAVEPGMATATVTPVAGTTDEFDVAVTPNPALPVGPFAAEVRLEAVEANGARHPVSPLPIRGEMQPPVRIVPRLVLLGEHPVGTRAEGEVELHLPNEAGWTVRQVEPGSPDLKVSAIASNDPGVLRFATSQTITAAGDQRTEVQFVLAGPNGKTLRVKTDVLCYGLPATK